MGARGPTAKPKLIVNQGRAVNRPAKKEPVKRNRPAKMPHVVKEMEKGKVLPVMLYPPVPLADEEAQWYGRLVRRRTIKDQEPLLPTSRLRREDSVMVMILARTLAALDKRFSRMLAKDANDMMLKLGCSPQARERIADAAADAKPEGEFDAF